MFPIYNTIHLSTTSHNTSIYYLSGFTDVHSRGLLYNTDPLGGLTVNCWWPGVAVVHWPWAMKLTYIGHG